MSKAEAGIGTLILFIALILIAAIASYVLLQTSNSLESRALATGSKTQTQVSTALDFTNIYAHDILGDSTLQRLFIDIKLVPGSDPINLNQTGLSVTVDNMSGEYVYKSTQLCDDAGALDAGTTQLNVQYIISGDAHTDGYLKPGDVARLCFVPPRNLIEEEVFSILLVPKSGSLAILKIPIPDVINSQTVMLYP